MKLLIFTILRADKKFQSPFEDKHTNTLKKKQRREKRNDDPLKCLCNTGLTPWGNKYLPDLFPKEKLL